jgi:hypothetical protein
MSIRIAMRAATIFAVLGFAELAGIIPARAANPPTPAISEEIRTAIAQMGKTLQADQFSFQARTFRTYADPKGQPLHIEHLIKVAVRRPDRLLIDVAGDDGSTKLVYDGKTAVLAGIETKKYAKIPVPNTIQGAVETLVGRLGVDFPLADFLTNAPDKAFLSGVTSGREVNTVTIDGVSCRHFLFMQNPGVELELWLEKNDKSLPRRLVVTYRSVAGEPIFVADLSDWNFSIHPSDADFVFQPPEGATQVELKPAAATTKAPAKKQGQMQ